MKYNVPFLFVLTSLLCLLFGMFYGVIGGLQYIVKNDFINTFLPFYKTRPIHVSLVISWIILCAVGGIYNYVPLYSNKKIFSERLAHSHFWIFFFTGLLILASYFLGIFNGREYFEFPFLLMIPIFIGWIFFAINLFKSLGFRIKNAPVYVWMWMTGGIFMLLTLTESNLWLIPFFRDNIVRDITVQWKSYGALIGSWNMLVYGTAAYIMCRIGEDECVANTPMAFALYFLGFTNLLFNWGHHTYIVPASPWIKHIAYFISMTELLILGRIMWGWRSTLKPNSKFRFNLSYKFLVVSEWWIFLNLILAILISIPAINIYTHGTHVTVAHAMGATIGINTMILLASVFFMVTEKLKNNISLNEKTIQLGLFITNSSLLILWFSLIIAGLKKGFMTYHSTLSFNQIMSSLVPYFVIFFISGIGIFLGITLIILPIFKQYKILLK